MSVVDARKYILEQYGVEWSGYWIRKLANRGVLRFVRPGGAKGWMYISRESIDDRFSAQPRADA